MRRGRASPSKVGAMLPRLKVVDLNPHLSCILCGGYFIDATTITECLHSFCRACIVRYLETSEYCPVCEVQVHKSKPLRSDKILQDIVYKLVPGLFHNEMKRRRELYASQPPEALKESRDSEDRGECLDEKFIYAPNEIFSLSIEYGTETEGKESVTEDDNAPRRRFLRCPAALTIGHLKKFVRMKYGIPNTYEVDLKYDKESLCDDYTLMDVAYIFLWKRKGPMRFSYKIVERPPKKLKSEPMFVDDIVETKSSNEPEPETKEETEAMEVECTSSSSQSEKVPQPQLSACSTEKEINPLPAESTTAKATEEPPAVEPCPTDVSTKTVEVSNPIPEDKKKTEVIEESGVAEPAKSNVTAEPAKSNVTVEPVKSSVTAEPAKSSVTAERAKSNVTTTERAKSNVSAEPGKSSVAETTKTTVKSSDSTEECVPVPAFNININKESKPLPFKFPPASLGKSPPESKPAVMTVAPFIKPSSTLPSTTSSTQSTHGLYTGISIKKSPPNTLPPFKISAHLLPPRVPPLKLSPPRFSKIETCLRELSSSSKKSSASKKSRSSRGSSDKLELKVAQLKSSASSFKYVAPLVISVPPEAKLDHHHHHHHHRKDFGFLQPPLPKKPEAVVPPPPLQPAKAPPVEIPRLKETLIPLPPVVSRATFTPPPPPPPVPPPPPPPSAPPANSVPSPVPESKSPPSPHDEDKMDLDLFEGPLVIAELDTPPKEDSNGSGGSKLCDETKEATAIKPPPPEDSEDEEIDVVDDCEADSGRGSDVSSRTEARSLCGDDDLGSPDSLPPKTPDSLPPKTPDAALQPPTAPPQTTNRIVTDPKANGVVAKSNGGDCGGALDLSTCGRKRCHDGDGPVHRAKQVANPAVLDKTRQTSTPCVSPDHSPFKVMPVVDMVPHHPFYGGGKQGGKQQQQQHESGGGGRGGFKCRGSNLAVINPNPNGNIPKLVIRNLGPRPGHERFHHHHHHHNHHHQRM